MPSHYAEPRSDSNVAGRSDSNVAGRSDSNVAVAPSSNASGRLYHAPVEAQTTRLVEGFAELTLETWRLSELEEFYREVLGLELLAREPDRVWLAAGQRCRLGLWSPGEKEFGDRGGRHVHFAFSASSGQLDRIAARLRARGVELKGPVKHDGGDRSLYFEDPAGNLVEVWDFFESGDGSRDGVTALR